MEINSTNLLGVITGISGMVTGIVGMFMGLRSAWISRYDITKEYFQDDDSKQMREARNHIYNNHENDDQLLNDKYYAMVCNHYHFFGLMLKKHYIPKYVFKGINREVIIKCYEHSKEYIKLRRKTNKDYAEYFEWLYNKLK